MGQNRGLWARRKESQLGNRTPKRHPSKFVPWILWIDWPYFGPTDAKALRPYVESEHQFLIGTLNEGRTDERKSEKRVFGPVHACTIFPSRIQ